MKKIVGGTKDEHGIFTKDLVKPEVVTVLTPTPIPTDISIDDLLKRGLRALYGLMRAIEADIASGAPERDTVMNLKDANAMLWEFKKKEQEFLDGISEEQLEKMLKKIKK